MITQARLKSLLHYDPETGVFTNIARRIGIVVGSVAGYLNCGGYRYIGVDRSYYAAHRLAWLYVHGAWPTNQIDHIDGNRSNNVLTNLREATHAENSQNQRKARADSSSGFLGVSQVRKRWYARIVVHRKLRHLGAFDTPEEAHLAYLKAKRELHSTCTI